MTREPEPRRLLCVLPSVPVPTNTGGALRTLHLLKALDAAFDVTVLATERAGTDAPALRQMLRGQVVLAPPASSRYPAPLRKYQGVLTGRPIGYAQYAGEGLVRALTELLRDRSFSLVHFDHLHTAQLLPVVRQVQPTARAVIDAHNVEAQVVQRMAEITPYPLKLAVKWQASRVRALEGALVSQADGVLACSARDKSLLAWMGARHVQIVPNGVAVSELARPPRPDRRDVIFVGSMDWWPNADAAMRLVKEIWPLCAPKLGDSRLVIAGRNPSAELQALGSPSVEITGTLESVAPNLWSAWASAIPLRAGSGTRLKILEAAAARVPVVATRLAAEGLPLVHRKQVLYAESPAEFAEALSLLHRDPAFAQELAESAFRVAEQFDWERVGSALAGHYRAWLSATVSPSSPESAGVYRLRT